MATEQSANELKQQGAIEAARDPQSSITAEDAGKKILEESRAAGVEAYRFDPDASTAEKKAQAREVGTCLQCLGPASTNFVSDRLFQTVFIPSERRVWPSSLTKTTAASPTTNSLRTPRLGWLM